MRVHDLKFPVCCTTEFSYNPVRRLSKSPPISQGKSGSLHVVVYHHGGRHPLIAVENQASMEVARL